MPFVTPEAVAQHTAVASEPEKRTLLVGLGNDLLSDDAIGLRIAAVVRERLADHTRITIAETTEMGLSLLDLIVGFDALVLVDAIQTNQAPLGFVHEIAGEDLKLLPAISPHFLGIGEACALGRQLGLSVPNRLRIFAIEVQVTCTVSPEMTPALRAALPGIVERVIASLVK